MAQNVLFPSTKVNNIKKNKKPKNLHQTNTCTKRGRWLRRRPLDGANLRNMEVFMYLVLACDFLDLETRQQHTWAIRGSKYGFFHITNIFKHIYIYICFEAFLNQLFLQQWVFHIRLQVAEGVVK